MSDGEGSPRLRPIEYNLAKTHATSIDQDNQRNTCKVGNFYSLSLKMSRYRKLYFMEYD